MKSWHRFLPFFLILCLLAGAPAVAQNGTLPMVTTDLLKIRVASQLDVRPDGRKAVYVVTTMGTDRTGKYRYFRRLWLADLDTKRPPRELTHGDRRDASPVWSPDGTRIAFVRSADGRPQIWILPLDGGEAWQLTSYKYGAFHPMWSPDGKRIAFESEIPMHAIEGPPPWPFERPGRNRGDVPNWKAIKEKKDTRSQPDVTPRPDGTLAEIRAWLAQNAADHDPRVFNRLNLQGEHDLQPDLSFAHVFLIDVKQGAEPRDLTPGFQDFGDCSWHPDGTQLVCSSVAYPRHPDRVRDSDLWLVPVDGGRPSLLLDWPDRLVYAPRYTPDGRFIVFVARDRTDPSYAQAHLAVIPASGGEPRWLTRDFDRSVRQPRVSPDGRWVYFTAASEGAFPLFRVPLKGGPVETVVGGPRGVRAYDLGHGTLVYALTEVADPWELYVAQTDGKKARRLTDLNASWLREKRVVFPQERWLQRPDGTRIQYWVMEPADLKPGLRYPLVLEIHGGPSAMWGPGEFTMWHEFQLLTSWGYGVVFCNPRGSGGYGHDFQKANYRNWGRGPAGDILAVVDEVSQLDWVDRDQLFVTGGSYAGYMTAWIVTQDHRFRAAVAQRGVYELSFFFGEGRAWRLIPWHFGGYPWEPEVQQVLDANSPQTYVAQVRTPLLIMHADRDLRTGTGQSEMLYKSLKVLERPVEYVRYPHEGHDLSRSGNPKRRMDRLDRILEYFERYVKHPEEPPALRWARARAEREKRTKSEPGK